MNSELTDPTDPDVNERDLVMYLSYYPKAFEKEEKEALKVLLREQRRRIRNKCDELEMNRSHTEDLSQALPLEQVKCKRLRDC
jgi:hypothetical protein